MAKMHFGFMDSAIFKKFAASLNVYGFGNASLRLIATFGLLAFSARLARSLLSNSLIDTFYFLHIGFIIFVY